MREVYREKIKFSSTELMITYIHIPPKSAILIQSFSDKHYRLYIVQQ